MKPNLPSPTTPPSDVSLMYERKVRLSRNLPSSNEGFRARLRLG